MIELTLGIIENATYQGKTFKHWVVFMPEGMDGAGMSVHIRKCLGVPYGGDDEVNATDWETKKLRVKLAINKKPFKDKKTAERIFLLLQKKRTTRSRSKCFPGPANPV
jgi:hypothetical protein